MFGRVGLPETEVDLGYVCHSVRSVTSVLSVSSVVNKKSIHHGHLIAPEMGAMVKIGLMF